LSACVIRSENKQIHPNQAGLAPDVSSFGLGTLNEMTIFMPKIKLNGYNQEA